MARVNLEYYALNYDCNAKKVVLFNIFQNSWIDKGVREAVKEYRKGAMDYKALVQRIDRVIMSEMCSRREYEISVCDAFETDIAQLEKWDIYKQVHPNIEYLVKGVLEQLK